MTFFVFGRSNYPKILAPQKETLSFLEQRSSCGTGLLACKLEKT